MALATPTERAELACLRWAESHDSFWRWGYYPHGTWGDGGGAYQFEPLTWLQATTWAGISPSDHSPAAQTAAALATLRHVGMWPWSGDGC